MLTIKIPDREYFDEDSLTFFTVKGTTLHLEHSLKAIAEWESKWKKPFLNKFTEKTFEESKDYIRCMCLDDNVDLSLFKFIDYDFMKKVDAYLDDTMTATTISKTNNRGGSREIITSELIYYWMTVEHIPFECENWNINRLLMLIQVCSIKNQPPKNMSKGEIARNNRALNAARRNKRHSRG